MNISLPISSWLEIIDNTIDINNPFQETELDSEFNEMEVQVCIIV